jgi:hypothetical protein
LSGADIRVSALVRELDEWRGNYHALTNRFRTGGMDALPKSARSALRNEAYRRGLTIPALIQQIVVAVVEDNLFSAVLDG